MRRVMLCVLVAMFAFAGYGPRAANTQDTGSQERWQRTILSWNKHNSTLDVRNGNVVKTMQRKAEKNREVQGVQLTQAEIVAGNGSCGAGVPAYFQAQIKNIGKAKANFRATLNVWHKSKEATHHPPAMSIAPGTSSELKVPLKSIPVTKAELSILEAGQTTPVTKTFPGWPCRSIP